MAIPGFTVLVLAATSASAQKLAPPPGAGPAEEQILFADLPKVEAATLANAPRNVSKLRLGGAAGPFFLSSEWRYVSSRHTWTRDRLGGALIADATTTVPLHRRCDLQVGLRNALNRRYEDPIYLAADRLRGDGRSAFVRLVWHVWE
jgi:hypothetical protein